MKMRNYSGTRKLGEAFISENPIENNYSNIRKIFNKSNGMIIRDPMDDLDEKLELMGSYLRSLPH